MRHTCWPFGVSPTPSKRVESFREPPLESPLVNEPTFLWSLMCDHFLIDQAGKYSFIGVFDRIGALAFPAIQRSLYIAVALTGPPGDSVEALLDVWSPEGALL